MQSKLVRTCGLLGLIGCVGIVATNIIGIMVVEQHNPIRETISNLAGGKYAWIQDLGLDLFGVGLIACAIALYVLNLDGWKWKTGAVLLGLLGLDVFVIAEHNQYANQDTPGTVIHLYAVYVLGLLFTLASFLLAFGLKKIDRFWFRFSLYISIIWLICGPTFFIVPTSWDGAYERFAALILIAWVAGISVLLIRERRR